MRDLKLDAESQGMFARSRNQFNIYLMRWCVCVAACWRTCWKSSSMCFLVVERIEPQTWEDVYVNTHYECKEAAAMVFCFFPVSGSLSTRQFLLFLFLLSGVAGCFIASHWYCSRTKKRAADKKWDLVDTQETLNSNTLITLFLHLLMSNIQAQDDKKKKNTEEEEIKSDMYIVAEHCGNHWEWSNTGRSELHRCLWGRRVLLQLLSHEAF